MEGGITDLPRLRLILGRWMRLNVVRVSLWTIEWIVIALYFALKAGGGGRFGAAPLAARARRADGRRGRGPGRRAAADPRAARRGGRRDAPPLLRHCRDVHGRSRRRTAPSSASPRIRPG